MKMEQTQCSEMLAFKLQTRGNNPKESIRHTKHDESLKSRKISLLFFYTVKQCKGKAIPLQAWTGPEAYRRLRLPDLKTLVT
jgi:hypothetical protein